MKKLFTVFFILTPILIYSQDMLYMYDAAGNRIEKKELYLYVPGGLSIGSKTTEELNFKLDSIAGMKAKIFPNPTEGNFQVELENFESSNSSLLLTDQNGRIIQRIDNPNNTNYVDINKEANGIYFMTLFHKDEKSTWRIIKK